MSQSNYIYHYTSAHALLQILKTRKLWATDINFLNDAREGQVARSHLELLASKMDPFHRETIEWFIGRRRHAYVTSFCRSNDNLSLYRMYAPPDGGYCIGFDRSIFKSFSGVELHDCDYSKKDQISGVATFSEELISAIDEGRKKASAAVDVANNLDSKFLIRFAELSACQKSSEFIDEQEIRLVSRAGWDVRKLRISSRQHLVIPYIEIEIPNEEITIKIVSGPNSNKELANLSTHELCDIARRKNYKWTVLHEGGLQSGIRAI